MQGIGSVNTNLCHFSLYRVVIVVIVIEVSLLFVLFVQVYINV